MPENPFAGTWKLISSEMRTSGGEVHYPLGQDCIGRIFFDASGNLSAQLMQVGRPEFATGDMMAGTEEEMVAAYKGFVSFWGAYQFDSETKQLTYVIEGSLFPNWVGHENLRFYEFEENRLTFKTPPFPMGGQEIVGVLIWERLC